MLRFLAPLEDPIDATSPVSVISRESRRSATPDIEDQELRLGVLPVVERIVGPDRATGGGIEDLDLGVKLGLMEQRGFLPEMALAPQMTVPTGSRAFTNDRVLPGINWLRGWELNDFVWLGGSTQFNRASTGSRSNPTPSGPSR